MLRPFGPDVPQGPSNFAFYGFKIPQPGYTQLSLAAPNYCPPHTQSFSLVIPLGARRSKNFVNIQRMSPLLHPVQVAHQHCCQIAE